VFIQVLETKFAKQREKNTFFSKINTKYLFKFCKFGLQNQLVDKLISVCQPEHKVFWGEVPFGNEVTCKVTSLLPNPYPSGECLI